MTTFFTSDHHFFHKNIIKLCDRPFKDLDEMHTALINNWNEVVHEDDTVYVVGDFSFGRANKTREILKRLKGDKILVIGNHDFHLKDKLTGVDTFGMEIDQSNQSWSDEDIPDFHAFITISHFPYRVKYFETVGSKTINVMDEHNALCEKVKIPKNIDMEFAEDDGYSWLLHGHVHKAWKIKEENRMINVGVDVWDYKPVSMQTLVRVIDDCQKKSK